MLASNQGKIKKIINSESRDHYQTLSKDDFTAIISFHTNGLCDEYEVKILGDVEFKNKTSDIVYSFW